MKLSGVGLPDLSRTAAKNPRQTVSLDLKLYALASRAAAKNVS